MKFNWRLVIIFLTIIAVSVLLRLYQINNIPSGLNIDESSEGYNAFSLLNTGKDRYGQSLPILFRSFGSFQAPLYTYLTIIPIYFFGNSVFSVRLVSVVSGIILITVTFFLLISFENKKKTNLSITAALVVAISPWAVFFSRIGTEASLGVTLFALSLLFFYFSLKNRWFFPAATLILGLSTHAYYSERLISMIFLVGFIWIFRKTIFLHKKLFILGITLFMLTQIPHLLIANSGAFTRRLAQVDYFSSQYFQDNSGVFRDIPFGRLLFITREFLSHYLAYFSPRNLFFDPDPQLERSIPNLSVFYNWMIVPFLSGLILFIKNRSVPLIKVLLLTIVISPIPAALTRDPFYTLRTLVFLWSITIVIAFGVNNILSKLFSPFFKFFLIIFMFLYSGISLYLSYFVIFQYDRAVFDYSYVKLLEKTQEFPDKKFVVDSSRQLANGIRFAFFKKYDPIKLQKKLGPKIIGQYYSNVEFDEPYILDNIEARSIIWKEDLCQDQVLVGDLLAISDGQIKEHYLKFLFEVKDLAGEVALKAYTTNPAAKCKLISF